MTLPADPPKLPKWPFLVGDGALIGLAWFISHRSPTPFSGASLIAVVACVVVGAVLATYPFVIEYTRAQEIALDDRQRALETLSLTVATSSEQISIVANGLHEITELAQRNLKVAEQLPMKIQEKMAAVSAGFEDARADEREELEREVATLRAAESEQLSLAAEKIARAVADLTRLEGAAQQRLSESAAAIARASDTLAPIDAKISASVERAERALAATARSLSDGRRGYAVGLSADSNAADAPPAEPGSRRAGLDAPLSISDSQPKVYPDSLPPQVTDLPDTTAGLMAADPFTASTMSVLEAKPASTPATASGVKPLSASGILAPAEPAPIPTHSISEIIPVAPRDSASMSPILLPADSTLMKPERKRAPRKPKSTPSPTDSAAPTASEVSPQPEFSSVGTAVALPEPNVPMPEPVAAFAASPGATPAETMESKPIDSTETVESAVSSDGATRLLVTAYIGIGNRLFIRGEGAGLSWDKGVPLQFVSIGKWRWESHDATAPISYKLYKNDSVECTSLGQQSLAGGSQSEVTAKF